MKILVCVITYNCADIITYFLRHYESFCDEIWAWDDQSTDETGPILSAWPKVKLDKWPYPGSGIDEEQFLKFAYETYPKARDKFDWVIWVDPDEFVYHPTIKNVLSVCDGKYDVIRTCGFNMIGDGMPKDDGRQIWELLQTGTKAPVYSKPIVFNPKCDIRWDRGKHHLERCNAKPTEHCILKLLHYRYLSPDYTRNKNARNYARCGLRNNDKGAAWSCSDWWKGEGSPEWVELAQKSLFNAIEHPCYD